MPNYEDCVIYTIRSGEHLYVGSTCHFTKRKHCHKSRLNNENNKAYDYKLYKTIRENDDEWDMQPYKLFPCKNKMEMRIEEERCRNELNANLNSCFCYGKDKERMNKYNIAYRETNKEKTAEYNKEYHIDNKERLKEKKTEYMKQYRIDNKERLKEYSDNHNKELYEKNKVIILQQSAEKQTCECGCIITKGAMWRHQKTKKHLKLLEEKQKNIKDI